MSLIQKELEDRLRLQQQLEDRILVNVPPGVSPANWQMLGRRMGKTTMTREWAEKYSGIFESKPMSPAEFNKEYLLDPLPTSATYTVTNVATQAPITLEAIEAVKKTIEASTRGAFMGILDSTASAAAGLARSMKGKDMDDTTKKQLEGIGAALMHRNAQAKPAPFELTGPMQLTIKTRQGQYKKKAFLGDESFTLSSQYVGKKEMILVFKNTRPVDYAFMEIPLDEAMTQLKGFKAFADAAGGGDINATLANIETVKTQEKRAEQAVLMQDPEFASW